MQGLLLYLALPAPLPRFAFARFAIAIAFDLSTACLSSPRPSRTASNLYLMLEGAKFPRAREGYKSSMLLFIFNFFQLIGS